MGKPSRYRRDFMINFMAVVTAIAQSPSGKIAYRGIDFTPEAGAH